jgi:hypothetical protein
MNQVSIPRKRKGELYRILVSGTYNFPIDMLRYDAAWPASEADAGRIEATYFERTRSGITSVELLSNRPPTEGRWQSFGWKVTEVR